MSVDRLWVSIVIVLVAAFITLRIADCRVSTECPVEPMSAVPDVTQHGAKAQPCSFPLKPALVVLSGTATLSLVLGTVEHDWGTNGNPGVLLAAAIAIAAVIWKGDHFEFRRLWQWSLTSMIAGVVFFVAGGSALTPLAGCMVCVSYEFCLMLLYSILADLVYRSYYNPTFLFSLELVFALSAGSLGGWAADQLKLISPGSSTTVFVLAGCLMAALFAAASIYAFSNRNLKGTWTAIVDHPLAQDIDLVLERSRLGLRCHNLAEETGLSRREEEVLLLTAQGKKPSAIAKQLGIAPSTVTTHKKHIYQKLDVHSAKELRARIENDGNAQQQS